MKTPEQMAKEYADYFMPGEDNKAYTPLIKEIAFLAGYKAAKDNQEYLMNEMSILRSRLDTAEKFRQLVDENKEQ